MFCSSDIFLFFFYLPVLSIYSRSANIRPVHLNWALYHYKTRPLTADWLQVCFGTWSDTAVKSVFQKLLGAPLTIKARHKDTHYCFKANLWLDFYHPKCYSNCLQQQCQWRVWDEIWDVWREIKINFIFNVPDLQSECNFIKLLKTFENMIN